MASHFDTRQVARNSVYVSAVNLLCPVNWQFEEILECFKAMVISKHPSCILFPSPELLHRYENWDIKLY